MSLPLPNHPLQIFTMSDKIDFSPLLWTRKALTFPIFVVAMNTEFNGLYYVQKNHFAYQGLYF